MLPTDPPHIPSQTRVIVGMSGGVDSSVTALLLQRQGYQVEGLFMKNWDEDDGTEYCTAEADLKDAQRVSDQLGIRLHTANFAADYWDRVFEHFLEEYQAGRTPNPDILCNREIKFKTFLDYAEVLGADFIATGHYVRRRDSDSHTWLCKGLDTQKDQSYFLHAVGEKEFSKSLFPVGQLEKSEVRSLAEAHGLVTHNKKDSTGICFIGERRFKDFLQQFIPAQPGPIINEHGTEIGEHSGVMYYTIGQRQGLHIGGLKGAEEKPWYVAKKWVAENQLLAVQGVDHPLLFCSRLNASQSHWINGNPSSNSFECQVKTRYRQPDQSALVTLMKDGALDVIFDQPQRAVTPGQSVVLYDGDVCLGGAVIEQAL